MRKEVKKLMAATLGLSIVIGAGNVIDSSAASGGAKNIGFSFLVKEECQPTNSESYYKRTAKDPRNAWGVQLDHSTEGKGHTATLFYLGKVNEGKMNEHGSEKHKIKEGEAMKYFAAYQNVSPGLTALYARDNDDDSLGKYSVYGFWNPQSGKKV